MMHQILHGYSSIKNALLFTWKSTLTGHLAFLFICSLLPFPSKDVMAIAVLILLVLLLHAGLPATFNTLGL